MQAHKCGHRNLGWWPRTTRHDSTSPLLPAYTTLAQAFSPNIARKGREEPKTKSGYLEHFLHIDLRREGGV